MRTINYLKFDTAVKLTTGGSETGNDVRFCQLLTASNFLATSRYSSKRRKSIFLNLLWGYSEECKLSLVLPILPILLS